MAKVSKQIHRLFLRLLNFTPELLAKTQEEAELQHARIDVLIRNALEKHLKNLRVARGEERMARGEENEAETGEYARLVLRAHFAEDRNEFLSENAIRRFGEHQRKP